MSNESRQVRGPHARSAQRRRQICEAVLAVVDEQGHENLTTADVARRAGASEPAVVYHFPTRDHLLVAGLQHMQDVAEEQLGSALPEVTDLDDLVQVAHAAIGHERRPRLCTCLTGAAAIAGHPAREHFRAYYARGVEVWSQVIEQRQLSGRAHPGLDPVEVARQVMATWDGLHTQWLVDPTFDLPGALVAAVRRLSGQNWMETRQLILRTDAGL